MPAPKQTEELVPSRPKTGPARDKYRLLYIVSHPRHIEHVPDGPENLVVATEWTALQAARERGLDAVHTDWARSIGVTFEFPEEDAYQKIYDWSDTGVTNLTCYKGVSLTTLYATPLALAVLDATRIDSCLRHLCATLSIEKIVIFDISTSFHFMGLSAKRRLIRQISDDFGLSLENKWDVPGNEDASFSCRSLFVKTPRRTFLDLLRSSIGQIVEWTFRILSTTRRRPCVYLYISTASLSRMVHRDPKGVTPVIPFESSPKTWTFLRACWKNGIIPVRQGLFGSGRKYIESCKTMAMAVETHWRQRPAIGMEAVFREIVREIILLPDALAARMQLVDELDQVMHRLSIRRVVTGDATAPVGRALCELARSKGIGADETLNGVFIGPRCDPIRMGIEGWRAPVSRELALGPAVERWLAISGTPLPSVITGYPALGNVKQGSIAAPERRKALVLTLYAWLNDVGAWSSELSPALVDMIRTLAERGFQSIRLKLHPGVDNLAYYQWLVEHFDLQCTIDQTGDFADHLAWADVVVGPAGSGTFLETLAAGKPYYVLRLQNTAIPDELLEGAVVGDTPENICNAISEGRVPDRDKILAIWCALGMVEDPSSAIWAAITESVEKEIP